MTPPENQPPPIALHTNSNPQQPPRVLLPFAAFVFIDIFAVLLLMAVWG